MSSRRGNNARAGKIYCTYQECPNTYFASSEQLVAHVQQQHPIGIRKKKKQIVKCPYCAHTATQPCNLEVHIRAKHTKEGFPCPHCTIFIADKGNLLHHVRRMHEDLTFSTAGMVPIPRNNNITEPGRTSQPRGSARTGNHSAAYELFNEACADLALAEHRVATPMQTPSPASADISSQARTRRRKRRQQPTSPGREPNLVLMGFDPTPIEDLSSTAPVNAPSASTPVLDWNSVIDPVLLADTSGQPVDPALFPAYQAAPVEREQTSDANNSVDGDFVPPTDLDDPDIYPERLSHTKYFTCDCGYHVSYC